MEATIYSHNLIKNKVGLNNLTTANYADNRAQLLLQEINNPFELYEIDDDNIYIRIFQENIDLNALSDIRWFQLEKAFHDNNYEWLKNYRLSIYEAAKKFGCKEVIIFSDPGPTEALYHSINLTSDNLIEFSKSKKFYHSLRFSSNNKSEYWENNAKHIYFVSFFSHQLKLKMNEFIEVIYDDFKDLK